MFKARPFLRALYLFALSWAGLLASLMILYSVWLRDWQMNWGANQEEIERHMIGDDLLVEPEFNTTRVVEIQAPPEDVWPWIVQMGMGRGGFYNFDVLDNRGVPSAERILPEYQDLKVGDFILPLLQVTEMDPDRHTMLWRFLEGAGGWGNATWSWGLYETEDHHTRLVSRLRQKYHPKSPVDSLMYGFQEVTEIFMMRTCLRGIKRRVEEYGRDEERSG
jgi:hypothetical protein